MKTETKKATRTAPASSKDGGFTDDERLAIKERAREIKSTRKKGGAEDVDTEVEVLAKIAEMEGPDRAMAERLHAMIKRAVPALSPRLWYGMPAYAKDGQLVCFFQPARKFKTRYATFGFSDKARLDEGNVWPNSYAVMRLTAADEARLTALIKQAVGA